MDVLFIEYVLNDCGRRRVDAPLYCAPPSLACLYHILGVSSLCGVSFVFAFDHSLVVTPDTTHTRIIVLQLAVRVAPCGL